MICTPMYNSQCTAQYTISMIELMRMAAMIDDIEIVTLFALNESLIHKTRNLLSHSFLKSDCTHMLFIDSDIGFKADQIIELMRADGDVVCGVYPKKSIKWENLIDAVNAGVTINDLPRHAVEYLYVPENANSEDELIDIQRGATGMMLISRRSLEILSDKVHKFKLESNLENVFQLDEKINEFFFTSIDEETGIYLHEDFNFCKLWRANGGKVHAATWVELTHSGMHTFG